LGVLFSEPYFSKEDNTQPIFRTLLSFSLHANSMTAFIFTSKQLLFHEPLEVVLYALTPCSKQLFVLAGQQLTCESNAV
jgi:hypothetical protein